MNIQPRFVRIGLGLALGVVGLAAMGCEQTVAHGVRSHTAELPVTASASAALEMAASVEGTYVRGQSCLWNETLTITHSGEFSRSFSGCCGASTATGPVRYSQADGLVVLDDARDPAVPSADGVRAHDPFLFVRWGARRYLVPEQFVLSFCDAVNGGTEPGGFLFIHEGDQALPTTGRPALPVAWRAYLLDHPVESVTPISQSIEAVWLPIGTRDGLLPGLELTVHDVPGDPEWIEKGAPPTRNQPLQILALEATRCRVGYKYGMYTRPPIPGGLRVTVGRVE